MRSPELIIKRPLLTEKGTRLKETGGQNEENLDVDRLYVTEAYVNEGPRQKRVRPAPMGRAYRVQKRTSHIAIWVEEK